MSPSMAIPTISLDPFGLSCMSKSPEIFRDLFTLPASLTFLKDFVPLTPGQLFADASHSVCKRSGSTLLPASL